MRHKKGAHDQALGRSRGGLTTKVHLVADALGRPVELRLTGGQVSDMTPALDLLDGTFAPVIIADRGYDGDRILSFIAEGLHAEAVIPQRRGWSKPRAWDRERYKERNRVERCFNRLKQNRRVATRYDKLAETFKAMVVLASVLVWFQV